VTAIPKLSRSARLRRVAAGGAFAIQAVAIARRLRPTVVHANDWNTMWAAIVISRISRAALIYDSHELWADRNGRWENRRWLIAAEALFVRTAGDVLVTSPGHGEALAARYRIASPQVIRNIPHQHRNASVTDPPPARSVIAYVGGLMPGRGLEQAIDALPELPGVALRAIGPSGTGYRQSLLDRATAAGVADRVEFPGAVAPEEIEQSLHGALAGLCLIQPICRSYELCLPNKLFEYVAAGLPVVASELPVIASVVAGNGLGIVVQSRDPTAIAAAVTALRDRRVRDGIVAAASQFAARNDSERELELLADVYRRALVRLQVNAERGHQSRNRR
jgi:glycosyltransferase involved in cell wall biosynthesis